jgi:hypothetical protein
MEIVVSGPFGNSSLGNFQFFLEVLGLMFFFFYVKWRDVGNLGWSVVVLKLVFPTLVVAFNVVDLLPFLSKPFF